MRTHVSIALATCLLASTLGGARLLEDEIERTIPFKSGDKLSLQALDGTIAIYGVSDGPMTVTANRKAFSPARLNALEVKITQDANGTKISTRIPEAKPWQDHSGTVDYAIYLPDDVSELGVEGRDGQITINGISGDRLSVALRNGRVTVRDCFCDQKVRVTAGGIDLLYDWPEQRAVTLDAELGAGSILVFIPSENSFRLHAEAPDGRVTSDFTGTKDRAGQDVSKLDETIGTATPSMLTLRARAGNIRVIAVD